MPKIGYTFIRTPDPDPRTVKERLAQRRGVYFAAEFVGTFLVFIAFEHDTLQELQDALASEYWDAGLRSETVLLVAKSRLAAPKRGSPEYCGIVRATIGGRNPRDVLDDLDRTFEGRFNADPSHADFWYGAGLVTGPYDLLIDLGARSTEEIDRMVLEEVRAIPGIRYTVTAYAYLRGNAWRDGKPEGGASEAAPST